MTELPISLYQSNSKELTIPPKKEEDEFEEYIVHKNTKIIQDIDDEIDNKIADGEISSKDLIALRSSAFQQIQNIKNGGGDQDMTRHIPANIVINVQNNYT